jgi:hypothetical protein
MTENTLAGKLVALIRETEAPAHTETVKAVIRLLKEAVVILAPKIINPTQDDFKTTAEIAAATGIDLSPLIQTTGDRSQIKIKTDLLDYFTTNDFKDDPQPFVVCLPMPGFNPSVVYPGQEAAPYNPGYPIRDGATLWLDSQEPVAAPNAICCEIYQPKMGGLFMFVRPFATQNSRRVGFKFTLKGNGRKTTVDMVSAYS